MGEQRQRHLHAAAGAAARPASAPPASERPCLALCVWHSSYPLRSAGQRESASTVGSQRPCARPPGACHLHKPCKTQSPVTHTCPPGRCGSRHLAGLQPPSFAPGLQLTLRRAGGGSGEWSQSCRAVAEFWRSICSRVGGCGLLRGRDHREDKRGMTPPLLSPMSLKRLKPPTGLRGSAGRGQEGLLGPPSGRVGPLPSSGKQRFWGSGTGEQRFRAQKALRQQLE